MTRPSGGTSGSTGPLRSRSVKNPAHWTSAQLTLVVAIAGLLLVPSLPALSGTFEVPGAPRFVASATGLGPAFGPTPNVRSVLGPRATFQALPLSTVVNPYAILTKEPAPMGIADFGVAGDGSAYRYTTPEFEGTLQLGNVDAFTDYQTQNFAYKTNDVTFQLNVILELTHGSSSMQFWVQDALFLNSTAALFIFGNNVWNFSQGSNAQLQSNSVVGNGSIGQGVYIDYATYGLPGNDQVIDYPVNVTTRVIASSVNGVPHVGLAYDDGSGMVTYDNVSFPWAHGWTVDGFVVDGSEANPIGLFDDAEWDYDGPAGGFHALNRASNLTMGLEYWNGHNLQPVDNAYNFGSDTAEATYNVTDSVLDGPQEGLPQAHLVSGAGSLGLLYSDLTVAEVNVSTPLASGTLVVGNTSVPYVGGSVNVTLAPGDYRLLLRNGSVPYAASNVSLSAGEYLALRIVPPIVPHKVVFTALGLPPDTPWSISINGTQVTAVSAPLSVSLLNGTYSYSVAPVPGYQLGQPYEGSITVTGAAALQLNWTQTVFPVIIATADLPTGVGWAIDGPAFTYYGSSSFADFSLPNGSYSYQVVVGIVYLATPANGTLVVAGAPASLTVSFGLDPGTLAGTVAPGDATVTVAGTLVSVQDGSFSASLPPGTYLVVASESGWVTAEFNVTLTPGNTSPLQVQLRAVAAPSPTQTAANAGEPPVWELAALAGAVGAAGLVVCLAWRQTHRPRPPPARQARPSTPRASGAGSRRPPQP